MFNEFHGNNFESSLDGVVVAEIAISFLHVLHSTLHNTNQVPAERCARCSTTCRFIQHMLLLAAALFDKDRPPWSAGILTTNASPLHKPSSVQVSQGKLSMFGAFRLVLRSPTNDLRHVLGSGLHESNAIAGVFLRTLSEFKTGPSRPVRIRDCCQTLSITMGIFSFGARGKSWIRLDLEFPHFLMMGFLPWNMEYCVKVLCASPKKVEGCDGIT